MIWGLATVAWAERREALRFIRLVLEQVSASELIRRAKLLKEDSELKRTLLLEALVAIHQSKPLRVSMKESVEMELLRTIGEIIGFSNNNLRLTKKN